MITIQHTALYLRGVVEKYPSTFAEKLKDTLAWVLLPDALRMYIPERQSGHHEDSADGTETSWMRYPLNEELKSLTKENARKVIKHYVASNIRPCVIGEDSNIGEFDKHNWDHPMYLHLRIHLAQDVALDRALREIVDCSGRFRDKFIPKHDWDNTMDGKTLRDQIANFEQIGYIRLAETIYLRTGIVMNQSWLDREVKPILEAEYPEDLAANTYRYMKIRDDINERISGRSFWITDRDRESCKLTGNLEGTLNKMYSRAYLWTMENLW